MEEKFNVCVDDDSIEILEWIHSHFDDGNWHRRFEVTVKLREFEYDEDGEKIFID